MSLHRPHPFRRRRSSALRLWARLRTGGPGEIAPPATPTPQTVPGSPAIDIHTGTPVLPSGQGRPSGAPTLILPLLLLTLALNGAGRARGFAAAIPLAGTNFRKTPCTHRPEGCGADTSRPIRALTGSASETATPFGATRQTDCRDCSDLRLGRLARRATNANRPSGRQGGGVRNPAEETTGQPISPRHFTYQK